MNILGEISLDKGLPISKEMKHGSEPISAYGTDKFVKGALFLGSFQNTERVYFELNSVFHICKSKLAAVHTSAEKEGD